MDAINEGKQEHKGRLLVGPHLQLVARVSPLASGQFWTDVVPAGAGPFSCLFEIPLGISNKWNREKRFIRVRRAD